MKKNEKYYLAFIALLLLIITVLHYYTSIFQTGLHEFYRKLYYIPIILAAFRFKLKGGLITSMVIGLLYAPYLFFYTGPLDIETINRLLEILLLFAVGSITGILVELQERQKRLLENQIVVLARMENYTNSILESILNGVVALNTEYKITTLNTEAKKLLNISESNTIDHSILGAPEVKNIFRQVLQLDKPIIGFTTKNQSGIPIRVHVYPLHDLSRKTIGLVVILENIQEVLKLEEQVRRADRLSAIGELASGIAHEIRNPLGIIKTISQTVQDESMSEEAKEGLQIIDQEINRANRVIEGLLDFARPKEVEKKVIHLNQLLYNIVELTAKYAKQHHVNVVPLLQENPEPLVLMNADVLKQAFINIIFNAVQAMPQGGRLRIQSWTQEHYIQVNFEDEGQGIPEENLDKIFNPFYTTKSSGTGLGLPITHRIIEEHHGTITVESAVGKGTKFIIHLPKAEV